MNQTVLDIHIENQSKQDILDKILKHLKKPKGFFHIVSLNPEIFVLSRKNDIFRKIIQTAQIRIIDGVGVNVAVRLLGGQPQLRYQGIQLMQDLLRLAKGGRLRVMLIGGKAKIAEGVADCQRQAYPKLDIIGLQGIQNIRKPKEAEEKVIWSIVADRKPHLIFVAFGSPEQEMWIYRNRDKFEAAICMGVGGAFDFLSDSVKRAPVFMQKSGLEWLYRLVRQPWRWRRQLRLITFLYLILRQKFLTSSLD